MSASGGTGFAEDYDLVKFARESSLAWTATAAAAGMQGQSVASGLDSAPVIATPASLATTSSRVTSSPTTLWRRCG